MWSLRQKNVESKIENCGVQNSIFIFEKKVILSFNSSHIVQSLVIVLPDLVAITYYAILNCLLFTI